MISERRLGQTPRLRFLFILDCRDEDPKQAEIGAVIVA
jgi:hypothetical protein